MLGGRAHSQGVRLRDRSAGISAALDCRELEDAAGLFDVGVVSVHLADCPGTLDQDCCFAHCHSHGCVVIGITSCGILEILGQLKELLASCDGLILYPALVACIDCCKIYAFSVAEIASQHGQAPSSTSTDGDRGVSGIFDLLACIKEFVISCRNFCACFFEDVLVVEYTCSCDVQRNSVDLIVISHL